MARKMRKFADGGNARYDRKVKDIESDYQKALKMGKEAGVAKAKYEQRMADAKDDLAKWTKADRTQTRAAEQAAERNLSEARRTKGESMRRSDAFGAKLAEKAPDLRGNTGKVEAVKTSDSPATTFAAAFRAARADKGPGSTFTWQGKSYSTNMAGEGTSKPKATQSASRSGTGSTGGNKPAATTTPKAQQTPAPKAQPPENKDTREIVVEGRKPKPTPKQWIEGKTAGERMGNVMAAPFKAAAKYNPLSLVASAIFDGEPSKPKAPRQRTPLEAERKADYMRRSQDERAAGRQGNADYYEREANRLKKGGKVKKYAKGGKIDGCAVRGKTRA